MALSPALVDREQDKFRPGATGTQSRVAVVLESSDVPFSSTASSFATLSPGMPAKVSVTASSTLLIPANSNRKFAWVANNTSKTIFVQWGAAAVFGDGTRLLPGSRMWITATELYLGDVFGITDAGSASIDVTEFTA